MNTFERIKSAIRPARPAVEFFSADGSRRDVTAELKRCFEDPIEIYPSKAPQRGTDEGLLVFARKVERAFGTTVPQETDEPQPDTFADLNSPLGELLVAHHPARTTSEVNSDLWQQYLDNVDDR
jgi:hypothetical protein